MRRFTEALILTALLTAVVAFPSAVAAGTATVRLTGHVSPPELTIAVGTTVVFRNDSGNRHRMRSLEHSGDAGFDTGDLEPGEQATVVFSRPGTWLYVDDRERDDAAFHGTITVVAESTGGSGSGASTSPPTSAAVTIGDRIYTPSSITIAAGGSVTWRNADRDEHTVSARDGRWDSGIRTSGATFTQRFAQAGTFAYLCLLHPDMTGTVVVRAGSGGAPQPPAAPSPEALPPATRPNPPGDTTSPSPSSEPAGGGLREVTLLAAAFQPATVTIPVGGTVRWLNPGPAIHTVSADGGEFETDLLRAGDSFDVILSEVGRYAYRCTLHPGMNGVIVVAAGSAAAAETTPDQAGGSAAQAPAAEVEPPVPDEPAAVRADLADGGVAWRPIVVLAMVAAAMVAFGRLIRSTVRPK